MHKRPSQPPAESDRPQALRRLRALLDEIDEQTRLPSEPPLREAVAAQARQRLAEMNVHGVLTDVYTPEEYGDMTKTVHFDLNGSPYPRIHATNNGTRTFCGRRIDHLTGTPTDHDDQPISWEQALHDCLDTCAACRRSYARAQRLTTGCRK